MASIFYVTDRGKYRAQTWDAHRKRRGAGRMFNTEYEAHAWAEATELDDHRAYRAHDLDPGRSATTVTFKAYAETWRHDAPPQTQRAYRSVARPSHASGRPSGSTRSRQPT